MSARGNSCTARDLARIPIGHVLGEIQEQMTHLVEFENNLRYSNGVGITTAVARMDPEDTIPVL